MDLRANTAVDVLIGPFIDDTDGNTAETGLTISQADVRLSKNGQNMAQKNDASAAAHDELGYHNCPLNTTDTNTEGNLVLTVHESGALPVRHEFNVIAEAAWDSLYAAKDTGYMDVNISTITANAITAAAINANAITDAKINSGALTNAKFAAGALTSTEVTSAAGITLANDAITAAKIADDAIGDEHWNVTRVTANSDQIEGGDATDAIRDAVVDDATRIDASALNTLSGHDPGANLGTSTVTTAQVNTEVDNAIQTYGLDHLLQTSVTGTDIADDSIIARLVSKESTADWDDFVNTTDSLQAIRDRGDAEWVTGAGGSAPTVGEIRTEMETNGGKLDHLWEMTEDDGGTRRYTENALEEAPSGTGASAATIADAVWDEAKSGHTAGGSFGEEVQAHALSSELSTHDTNIEGRTVSSTAAGNLEDTYDGTGYANDFAPATQASVGNIGSGAAGAVNFEAIEDNASGAIIDSVTKIGNPTGTFANTDAEDGSVLSITDVGDDIDWVFGFNVGGSRQATEVAVVANLTGNQDDMKIQAYDIVADDSTWNTVGTISGTGGDEYKSLNLALLSKHTGVGANLGEVYIRFVNDPAETPAILAIDKCLVAAVSTSLSVGYALGAIWVDTAGTAGTEINVNGTADNPCPWANALTLNDTLGLNRFHIANDNTVTLSAAFADKTMFGEHYYLALGGQNINDSHFTGATATGIASAASHSIWSCCEVGAATIPPCKMTKCGIGYESGKFTAASNGDYTFHLCYSLVPGSGSPEFDFDTNISGATGVNNRAWSGGSNYSGIDANVTLSHEVIAGGGQTIVADAGGNIELRGTFRSANLTVGGTDQTIQVVGTTGVITISGSATTGIVNLYGVASSVANTSTGTTVTDATVNSTDQNAILEDTADLQSTKGERATATGFATPTNITAGTITTVSGNVDGTVAGVTPEAAGVVPTANEVRDAIVDDATRIDASALNTHSALTAASIATGVWEKASARTDDFGTLLEQLADFHFNDLDFVNATGVGTLRNKANSADLATWQITDDDTNTTRTDVVW